jgi:hypothetical protein
MNTARNTAGLSCDFKTNNFSAVRANDAPRGEYSNIGKYLRTASANYVSQIIFLSMMNGEAPASRNQVPKNYYGLAITCRKNHQLQIPPGTEVAGF